MASDGTKSTYMADDVGFNRRHQIIKDIEHIYFFHLKTLKLAANNICSIEGLDRIYMPDL